MQITLRFVAEDFTFKGCRMKKNQLALINLGAANRDPRVFGAADSFDIHRKNNIHVGFGHGFHLCLGMALARLETRLVLETLASRFENITLGAQELRWGDNPFFRGLEQLQVRL